MKFSRSTYQLMCFSLETLTTIIMTGLPILVELIDLVNSVIIFLKFISNDFTQMVNFPTWIPDCDSHDPSLLDLFISSGASICSTMVLSQFPLTFHDIHNGIPRFIALLMTILVLIGMVFVII